MRNTRHIKPYDPQKSTALERSVKHILNSTHIHENIEYFFCNIFKRCINDCGELHPELYADNARTATDDEEGLLMEHFADQVRQLWALGACGNDILILYSQELNKVF